MKKSNKKEILGHGHRVIKSKDLRIGKSSIFKTLSYNKFPIIDGDPMDFASIASHPPKK